MIFDLKGIVEGLTNAVFVKEEIEKLAQYRLSICNNCEHYSPNIKKRGLAIFRKDKYCDDCKCNMHLKTRYLTAQCPLGAKGSKFPLEKSKWGSVSNDEQLADRLLETEELKKDLIAYKTKLSLNKEDEHE